MAERARELLMAAIPDHMAYAPIGSPAGTGFALAAMLQYASEREAIGRAAGREEARAALERSVTALDDWLHTYAADLCHQADVDASAKRIGEYGTLAYIADVQQQNRRALAALPVHGGKDRP